MPTIVILPAKNIIRFIVRQNQKIVREIHERTELEISENESAMMCMIAALMYINSDPKRRLAQWTIETANTLLLHQIAGKTPGNKSDLSLINGLKDKLNLDFREIRRKEIFIYEKPKSLKGQTDR